MAYPRKYPRSRKQKPKNGRARFKRAGASAGSAAYTALKMARKLMDAVNIEYKEVGATGTLVPDWNGIVYNLTNIPVGSGQGERVGDSLKLQNLTLRYFGVAKGGAQDLVRIIIYHDKQNAVTTAAQLLGVTGNAYGVLSPKQEDNKYNTKVLYDQVIPVTQAHAAPHKTVVLPLNWHQHYVTGSTTLTDGALKMCLIAIGPGGAGLTDFYWMSNVSYTDN